MVYAKCDVLERVDLWNNIYNLSNNMRHTWLVGGNFNVILNEEEKIDGLPIHSPEYEDFAFCLNSCELFDIHFKGSPYTWWSGKANE